ncbi:MAG TPA: exo-beta-N-acetylmuramidase NamZ domain-containing protein [Fimbriimonas sp.]|nr:exo-beta-N-acetylmuramidase NamZ domain-containing protein [Fimbriimonas sp.]
MRALACLVLAVSTLHFNLPFKEMPYSGSRAVDETIQQAITEGRLPGAVLLIGHDGHVAYEKAYGNRSVEPDVEPMTEDTIFDCASLTKVIATTSCLMKLYEQGKFRLNDPVTEYLPEFQGGHSPITLRNLMTHFSGLKPDVALKPEWRGYETGIHLAETTPPETHPGTEHIYSDINFELLGEIVHKLSGETLDQYAHDVVFAPLGMKDTMFNPPASLIPRIAPTEHEAPGKPVLRGVVHDPTARYMGGVAGHAGLFSTASDLSRFAQMMLNGGELDGVRVFSRRTIKKFTEPQTPLDQPILRGLGWDIDSPYSSNRGELFPIGSYGHTGFTGTSIWIDPYSKSYVILLANAVHPDMRKLSVISLRAKISTIVAASLGMKSPRVSLTGYNDLYTGPGSRRPIYRTGQTMTGLDVLEADKFKEFEGKKIGLVTNQSGLDREGRRNVDVMLAAGVQVKALFSPEHGFAGKVDQPGIGDTTDAATGLPIHSLYGDTLHPTPESLQGLDALVYDIQDAGVRFYTFETTMAYCMEAAAKAHIPFYVLDRPNPITGARVEGPTLDKANASFVGYLPDTPVRHGMTMGELATMDNAENHIGADLKVVKMQDWERGDWFDSTGLTWINPSPNLRSLKACILYPGLCFLEFPSNFSVGRGTDAPFEQVGADFVDGQKLANYLNRRHIPGIRVYPTTFTPTESRFEGQKIQGVRFEIISRELVDSTRIGLELACALQELWPGKIDWSKGKRLIGSDDVLQRIADGQDPYTIQDSWIDAVQAFAEKRAKYLLY